MASQVYVIGGGFAGLSAALAAANSGAYVVLVDKEKGLGGNSAKATSGVNAVASSFQREKQIDDSIDLFAQDTKKSGHNLGEDPLIQILAARSGDAVDGLQELNITLSDIEQLGGHSAKRTHRFPPKDGRAVPVGFTVSMAMRKAFDDLVAQGKAGLRLNTALVDFEVRPVVDLKGHTHPYVHSLTLKSDDKLETIENFSALVLTAGGYAADTSPTSLLAKFRPDLTGFPTTNGPFASGDTLRLAISKGMKTVDMDKVQLHPTSFVDVNDPLASRKFLCPEVMRGVGAILVNARGERFSDELKARDIVSSAIIKHGVNSAGWRLAKGTGEDQQKMALMIISQETADRFGMAAFKFYESKGFIFDLSDAQALSRFAPTVDPDTLAATIETYNMACDGMIDDPFGKTVFPTKIALDQPIYGAYITPALHYTMGGIAIAPDARARTVEGDCVVNLFVAGENSGGLHGGNRLGGNGCAESLVFGKLAGRVAATLSSQFKNEGLPVRTSVESLEILAVLSVKGSTVIRAALPTPADQLALSSPAKALIVNSHRLPILNMETLIGVIDIEAQTTEETLKMLYPGVFVALQV